MMTLQHNLALRDLLQSPPVFDFRFVDEAYNRSGIFTGCHKGLIYATGLKSR